MRWLLALLLVAAIAGFYISGLRYTITFDAIRARKFASSRAVSPPPTTTTSLLRKKKPSHVAQAETPRP